MPDYSEPLFSLTVSACGNNNFCQIAAGEETEFLSWYRVRKRGELSVTIKYFNRIYSTGCGVREQQGPAFTVTGAWLGYAKKPSRAPETEVPLFFGGEPTMLVTDGYESDPADINIPEEAWLSVRLKVRADNDCALLTTDESASSGYKNGLRTLSVLRPNFIGCRGDFKETLLFFGDSITQGTRTATDKYESWSHRVGLAMPENMSVINLGMGWSRAYDAAADGIFMKLARLGTVVTVCFGVNDIKSGGRTGAEIIGDLRHIIDLLRENNPEVKIILFTVPPFNLEPYGEEQRQIVNREILGGAFGTEVFDFGAVLEGDPGRVRPEYMSDPDDAHPNGLAGEAAARALLESGLIL